MIKFYGIMKNGQFLPDANLLCQWNEFSRKNENKRVSMGASKVYKQRTLKQNKTIYGPWVDHCIRFHRFFGEQALRESGCKDLESSEAKWWIQVNFFPRRKYMVLGEFKQRVPGSSELDVKEMMKALEDYNMFVVGKGFNEFIPEKAIEEYEEQ